jgi:anti-anti-sigma regulatory factor
MRSDVEITMASASVAVISLGGEHDMAGSEVLRTGFARAAIHGERVIVDLTACDFIDSTVISMLLHTETIVARDSTRSCGHCVDICRRNRRCRGWPHSEG